MSMEKDIRTVRNVVVAFGVAWLVLLVVGIGSYLYAAYKARKADEEDESSSGSSSSSGDVKVSLSALKK